MSERLVLTDLHELLAGEVTMRSLLDFHLSGVPESKFLTDLCGSYVRGLDKKAHQMRMELPMVTIAGVTMTREAYDVLWALTQSTDAAIHHILEDVELVTADGNAANLVFDIMGNPGDVEAWRQYVESICTFAGVPVDVEAQA